MKMIKISGKAFELMNTSRGVLFVDDCPVAVHDKSTGQVLLKQFFDEKRMKKIKAEQDRWIHIKGVQHYQIFHVNHLPHDIESGRF